MHERLSAPVSPGSIIDFCKANGLDRDDTAALDEYGKQVSEYQREICEFTGLTPDEIHAQSPEVTRALIDQLSGQNL